MCQITDIGRVVTFWREERWLVPVEGILYSGPMSPGILTLGPISPRKIHFMQFQKLNMIRALARTSLGGLVAISQLRIAEN